MYTIKLILFIGQILFITVTIALIIGAIMGIIKRDDPIKNVKLLITSMYLILIFIFIYTIGLTWNDL